MTHCIMRGSEILAKKKSTENQVISVLCGDLPFCPVTPLSCDPGENNKYE